MKDLEKQRLEYEKSPENHPLYPDEWKVFWNRRYKELQAGLEFHCKLFFRDKQIHKYINEKHLIE